MKTIDPKSIPTPQLHQLLVSAVSPRPIAFVSTVDEAGNPNLAPYSFFNCFSSNPPILVFSSNRKVRDNTTKDTLHNVEATREVVINMVNYEIVRQAAVASVEFPPQVNEFEKAGLTPLASDLVRPFRVKESPVQMECKVQQILPLGEGGGAGHLIICEVVRIHISEAAYDAEGRLDPHKLDLMGRMGRAFYVRASGEAVHTIFQDMEKVVIGFDQLPRSARESRILTGNDLGALAGMAAPPAAEAVEALRHEDFVAPLLAEENPVEALHRRAQQELEGNNVVLAAQLVWLAATLPSTIPLHS
jgi:flavin reductase (DIM6/NTAB) family NADH-FMN oxidoreductase RutF